MLPAEATTENTSNATADTATRIRIRRLTTIGEFVVFDMLASVVVGARVLPLSAVVVLWDAAYGLVGDVSAGWILVRKAGGGRPSLAPCARVTERAISFQSRCPEASQGNDTGPLAVTVCCDAIGFPLVNEHLPWGAGPTCWAAWAK